MTVGLHAIVVGDDPEAWEAAGFRVDGATVVVGGVAITCAGDDAGSDRWVLAADDGDEPPADVDGIATRVVEHDAAPGDGVHPNGISGFDHLVVRSPDLDRTTAAFGRLGVDCRRVRDTTAGGHEVQQRFFRLGTVIVELVGPAEPSGDGPAALWGCALVSDDIDATAAHLGDRLGPVKDAVQPGRRIATLRTRELGISIPVAVMSPHRR